MVQPQANHQSHSFNQHKLQLNCQQTINAIIRHHNRQTIRTGDSNLQRDLVAPKEDTRDSWLRLQR